MVKSAVRVLEILDAVGSHRTGLSQKDLAAGLGIPKSSLSNLLADLTSHEYLVLDRTSGNYVLGPHLLVLAGSLLDNQDVVGRGRRLAAELAEETGESVALAIPAGWHALIVYKEDGTQDILPSIRVGTQLPLYASAVGKAILAHLPENEIRRYLEGVELTALTPRTITAPEKILAELKTIQAGALAYNRGYFRDGVSALAAPIFDYSGRVVASLAFNWITDRMSQNRETELADKISRVAEKFSRLMGYPAR